MAVYLLFLAIWAVGVFILWKNGPARANPPGAALGVFFLVWGLGGCAAMWLGRSGMQALGALSLGLGLLLAFTGAFACAMDMPAAFRCRAYTVRAMCMCQKAWRSARPCLNIR